MDVQSLNNSKLGDRYTILQRIGKGGMSSVYIGQDHVLDRKVAIKILKPELSGDASFIHSFYQEAKSAAQLTHPNIVTIYDFGFHDHKFYIVLEYVPGNDLKSLISKVSKFDIGLALNLTTQASYGIGYAHHAGLVHCDIKPQNLLVTPEFNLKVTDFGIAKALNTTIAEEKPNVIWGSPQYISPEQASGKSPLPASDVYSLGVIIYELLTGNLPFVSDDPLALLRKHREDLPIPPSQINPEIPPNLERIILKVLSKEPTVRYRNAEQLGQILDNYCKTNDLTKINSGYEDTQVFEINNEKKPHEDSINNQTIINDNKESHQVDIDLITIGLSLLAVIFSGGLIPFWLFIYLTLTQ